MNMRSRLPLALALALGSSSAFALGLGQIEVKSALNQPLSAEIPVLSSLPGEADALVVRLAPPEALARVGLPEPTGVAANLEFAVDTNDRGETVIRVSTSGKVADPFVTFLLEVDWGKGKMLREYTVLLDPPTMAPVRREPAATTPIAEAEPAAVEPLAEAPPPPPMTEAPTEPASEAPPEPTTESLPQTEPVPVDEPAPSAESILPAAPDAAPARVDNYGPVASGETLWSIATFARPDESVSMNQMMLAMLYANPDAFINQNINRLKKGAILRIPSREEALAIAAADAAAQVREQMQVWREQTQRVVQPAEPEPIDSPSTSSTAGTAPSTDSRLELVPPRGDATADGPQSGASVGGEGRELRAELTRAREEVSTLNAENVELKSRVGELENMQQDRDRLISLKDSELAAAQARLAELEAQRTAEAAAADATPPVGDASVAVTDATITPDAATGTDPATAPTDVVATDTATTPTDAATTTPATDVTSTDTTATAPPPESAPVSEPLPPRPPQQPWYMSPYVMGGGGLVLVGLLALLFGRRKKAPVAVAAPRYGSSAVASSIAAVQANAVSSRVQPEPEPEEDEDNPAIELAEAVARDPGNLTRHLELVRHYYEVGDAAGFEHAAEAMYARVYDPDHLAWKQVMAMGREIAPEHPLFSAPVAAPVPTPAPAPAAREIDWGQSQNADAGSTQRMKLDDVQAGLRATPAPAPSRPAAAAPAPAPAPTRVAAPEPVAAPVADTDGFIDADAASTKLELARAYLDMGDVDGARGMLEEVVNEGNPGQRAEAKRLLDEIR
jgi:pilus assembly protein FimV